MTDQHTVYNSRMFCTQWNGLEKSSIFDDALDDKEYDIYSIRSVKPKSCLDIQRHMSLNFPQQQQISGSS